MSLSLNLIFTLFKYYRNHIFTALRAYHPLSSSKGCNRIYCNGEGEGKGRGRGRGRRRRDRAQWDILLSINLEHVENGVGNLAN